MSTSSEQLNARGVVVRSLAVDGPSGPLVRPLGFTVGPGRTLAIIGESGSGKSVTARALTGLLPRGLEATGSASIDGDRYPLSTGERSAWDRIRGRRAVLLLQDPFTSLNPVIRCGAQIGATVRARMRAERRRVSGSSLKLEVERRLDEVRLPPDVARRYPSELSGGMRQRVAIAAALAAEPRLLIADEPTTALDASTQGGVLDLLGDLQKRHEMSLLLISHDLGVVAGRADDLIVMRRGEVVERGRTNRVLAAPEHHYTRALLDANLSVTDTTIPPRPPSPMLLTATGVSKRFGSVTALDAASVDVARGEIVAVVGESGSGKSTLARCIAGLEVPEAGTITLDGRDLPPGRRGRHPGEMQIVFQDPYSTLNPVFTIDRSLRDALRLAGGQTTVGDLLELVELDPALGSRHPSQLSGGQRQRVAIARALAPNPQLLICDESVSALDVSVQRQILDLLIRLRDELDLAMLFITHDLGVVANIASRAIVLQRGVVVERGSTAQILRAPQHPYTKSLVQAAEHDSIHGASAQAALQVRPSR
ncbi:ABC transporter ATP-binding protein [Agromyces mediolanus]|uniref:ATP-binding cassette domain-containing protein n=1 Tax=Agromyces mediolanus TaxID=41986 RepID=UPI00203A697A|nr:ABC transporter ATP-binding protein [Agromyces mediolanus]MCM3656206.1 ABC transporter ATP-binding protein [Agromyces mediolanus]